MREKTLLRMIFSVNAKLNLLRFMLALAVPRCSSVGGTQSSMVILLVNDGWLQDPHSISYMAFLLPDYVGVD